MQIGKVIGPLVATQKHRKLEGAKLLLDHGAACGVVDADGRTAMHHAAFAGDADLLALFADRGASASAV